MAKITYSRMTTLPFYSSISMSTMIIVLNHTFGQQEAAPGDDNDDNDDNGDDDGK